MEYYGNDGTVRMVGDCKDNRRWCDMVGIVWMVRMVDYGGIVEDCGNGGRCKGRRKW